MLSSTSNACYSQMLMPCCVPREITDPYALAAYIFLRNLLTGLEYDTSEQYTCKVVAFPLRLRT